jgi:adenosylmethionine-8-amino-7-oxononanoate aminotransferase
LDVLTGEALPQRVADEAPFFEALLHDALSDKPHVSDVRNYGFAGAITLEPYPGEPLRRPFEVAMKMWEKGISRALRRRYDSIGAHVCYGTRPKWNRWSVRWLIRYKS